MFPKRSTKSFGDIGEDFAIRLLKGKGYKILARNFRSRFGEIDIIAIDSDTLVFVEVKTRWSKKFGAPEEAVTPRKLFRIKKTGEFFSITHPTLPTKLRVDVVALEVENKKVVSSKLIKVGP